MPEGHTVHRLARAVRAAFGGRVVGASSPQGRFDDGASRLDGHRLARSEAVGKHLLVGFLPADAPPRRVPGQWLHVHLGLYGTAALASTDVDDDGGADLPAPVGAVRLRLVTLAAGEPLRWMDLRGPTACEVLLRAEVDALRARLGPDPLRRDDGPERFLARAAASRVALGALLMHQDVLAGAGNVYRAEALFRAGLDPFAAGRDVEAARLVGVWDDLRVLMRSGVRTGRIVTTRPADRGGLRGRVGWHYVYRRTGLPCRVCGTPVAAAAVEARTLYWCPTCQAPGARTSPLAA